MKDTRFGLTNLGLAKREVQVGPVALRYVGAVSERPVEEPVKLALDHPFFAKGYEYVAEPEGERLVYFGYNAEQFGRWDAWMPTTVDVGSTGLMVLEYLGWLTKGEAEELGRQTEPLEAGDGALAELGYKEYREGTWKGIAVRFARRYVGEIGGSSWDIWQMVRK